MDVLLVDADLLGRGRIEAAATKAGAAVHSASVSSLGEALKARTYELVVVDLDRGGAKVLDALDDQRDLLPEKVIAYVSHVDKVLADEALGRGYDVMARGRFWRSLEGLFSAG